jgi:hypothetical protein
MSLVNESEYLTQRGAQGLESKHEHSKEKFCGGIKCEPRHDVLKDLEKWTHLPSVDSHLDIHGVTLFHPFFDLFDCIGRVTVKHFKV